MSRYDLNPGGLVDNILSDAANLPLTEIHDFMTGEYMNAKLNQC